MTPRDALQTTLAGEHAAVYVYRALGGRVSASAEPGLARDLTDGYVTHRARRDQLAAMVRAVHGDPVAADVSYELPNAARTATQLREAALVTEQRMAGVYAQTVGSTAQADRQWAIDALADAAVRQLRFGGRTDAFPGVAEL